MTVRLGELTWRETEARIKQNPVAVIPVGSTEQHAHLALETDFTLVTSIMDAAAQQAQDRGIPMLVTPGIWTGLSPHHMDFPGTITLRRHTLELVIRDVCQSLWQHGIRKIFLTSGHGGNTNTLRAMIDTLYYEHGILAATANYWEMSKDEINRWRESTSGGCFHACELETALMMHLAPHDVRPEMRKNIRWVCDARIAGGDLTNPRPGVINVPLIHLKKITPYGSVGDCESATPEKGKLIFDAIVAKVAECFVHFHSMDATDLTRNDLTSPESPR
jgi:creatinine amidohydrolase